MKKLLIASGIAFFTWIVMAFCFALVLTMFGSIRFEHGTMPAFFVVFVCSVAFSFPAFIFLLVCILFVNWLDIHWKNKIGLFLFTEFLIAVIYGIFCGAMRLFHALYNHSELAPFSQGMIVFACLFLLALLANLLLLKPIISYFSGKSFYEFSYSGILQHLFFDTHKTNIKMETLQQQPSANQSNRILIKGVITAVLILLMLIPTLFVQNLVTERELRQKEVVKEVSSKWAASQTVSGLYLSVPYTDSILNENGKTIAMKRQLIIIPNNLDVKGQLFPEERPRSIYKVLLYKTTLQMGGVFKPVWPVDINPAQLDFANSRICFNLSDFKGIQEELSVSFNGQKYLLSPGLPVDDFGTVGLSVPVSIDPQQLGVGINFAMEAKLKGSEQLRFLPLSANSKFNVNSKWSSPSFDGNSLPNIREVKDTGFVASWSFNQANLPFTPVFFHGTSINAANLAFGVSLVQPADQYDKTMRSVKYAILFIGLTFALFFIVELMQKRPFHPVQYVLVGLALVIFYTLLLSISEYILFDHAYLVAAAATIILITLYARSHFLSWKTAGVFCGVLSCLYSFIFILIRLENTALLIGSIGLFAVLALVMYASRKVNWYGGVSRESVIVNSQ